MSDVRSTARSFDETLEPVRVRVLGGSAPARVSKAALGEPDDSNSSNQVNRDDHAVAFSNLGTIDPIYDPEMLCLLFEHSNSLRQNVDSYATNIDAFGHRFEPIFDLDSPDVDKKIANAMAMDALRLIDNPSDDKDELASKDPDPAAVAKKKDQLTRIMRAEKARLESFFENCSLDVSFVTLRQRTRQDLEVTGNAYWEILRNRMGQASQFLHVPSFTIRLLPLERQEISVKRKVRVSDLTIEEVQMKHRPRRFVQIVEGVAVYFKEFGDPRIVSAESGKVYETVEALQLQEPGVAPATEILHFKIHSTRSSYGVPRWIGNLLSVIGSRQSEEVNFNYFENKSVPPLAILVNGGRMSKGSVERITSYIDSHVKGKRNFHRLLVLEAETSPGTPDSARTKIDLKPLTSAQHNDALFQNYDERNMDKVGQAFRLPRLLRGDIRDFNRSTADAALTFAEMQVFEPERHAFDFEINRKILMSMGIRFWRFQSQSPVTRDPATLSTMVKDLVNAGVLTPEEGREISGEIFNREFRRLSADWTKQPVQLSLAGIPLSPEKPSAFSGPDLDENGPTDTAPAPKPAEGIQARQRPMLGKRMRSVLEIEARKMIVLRKVLETAEGEAWLEEIGRANGST